MLSLQEIATRYRSRRRQRAFTSIYKDHAWIGSESRSGHGSGLEFTASLRSSLPKFLEKLEIKTLLDAPCGDFAWMKEVDLALNQYYGVDIVEPLIDKNRSLYGGLGRDFLVCDVVHDELPKADLILCRHLLIHLTFEEGFSVLRNFRRSGARYLLITDQPAIDSNHEILKTASFRPLNLRLPPFSLPAPVHVLNDNASGDGSAILALYSLADLPIPNAMR